MFKKTSLPNSCSRSVEPPSQYPLATRISKPTYYFDKCTPKVAEYRLIKTTDVVAVILGKGCKMGVKERGFGGKRSAFLNFTSPLLSFPKGFPPNVNGGLSECLSVGQERFERERFHPIGRRQTGPSRQRRTGRDGRKDRLSLERARGVGDLRRCLAGIDRRTEIFVPQLFWVGDVEGNSRRTCLESPSSSRLVP